VHLLSRVVRKKQQTKTKNSLIIRKIFTMDMDQAAVFLAGSVLTMMGFVVVVIGIVAINNIIHKYWKPVKMFTPDSWKGFNPPYQRIVHEEEIGRVAPHINESKT